MYCVNLRFSFPCVINILKIFWVRIMAWDWDPYNIMGDLSWMKVICLLLLVLVFSFISIEVRRDPSLKPWYFRLCLSGEYTIPMAISLTASLIVPPILFWLIYPVILLLSFCSPWLLNLLVCLQGMASRARGCNIIITTATAAPQSQLAAASQVIEGRCPGEEDPGSEESENGDLEANLGDHQVVASRVPDCNIIIISATAAPQSQLAAASQVIEGRCPGEDDPGSEESEHGDLEANLGDHQVVVTIT